MEFFRNKFRIDSIRLKDWDYSIPSWYYVTMATRGHRDWFGMVVNGKVSLNNLGKIVDKEWLRTSELRDDVELDYYIIMPNHFHGIMIINPPVETRRGVSLQPKREFSKPIKNSLSVIINQFKGSVKRWANKNGIQEFQWQRGFYDHIIRNEKDLYQIRKYIIQNPLKWDIEKNDPENIYL